MAAQPECIELAAGGTRIAAVTRGEALQLLDTVSGELRTIDAHCHRPNCLAVTDTHILTCGIPYQASFNLYDLKSGAKTVHHLPVHMRVTHAVPDTDSDGFLVFGYRIEDYRRGRAYLFGVDGTLQPLATADQNFWSDYCRMLPGRRALLSYGPPTVVDLNTGAARDPTPIERALHAPSTEPFIYGMRYTRTSFPRAEREFAPSEAYTLADHRCFGPRARAAARTVLLLARLGYIRLPGARLLEHLLSYVVRTAAPPRPRCTHA